MPAISALPIFSPYIRVPMSTAATADPIENRTAPLARPDPLRIEYSQNILAMIYPEIARS